MVILVPPEEGPDLGEIPVISGLLLEDNTWPRVGARRGLKRGNGFNFVELVDGEAGGDNAEVEPPATAFRFPLLSSCKDGVKLEAVYRFSIDREPFKEIEAASIEALLFERSFETLLSPKDNKLFHFTPSLVEVAFLKERTQQSIHRSPFA